MTNSNLTLRFFERHIMCDRHFICEEQINGLLVCNQIKSKLSSLVI